VTPVTIALSLSPFSLLPPWLLSSTYDMEGAAVQGEPWPWRRHGDDFTLHHDGRRCGASASTHHGGGSSNGFRLSLDRIDLNARRGDARNSGDHNGRWHTRRHERPSHLVSVRARAGRWRRTDCSASRGAQDGLMATHPSTSTSPTLTPSSTPHRSNLRS
jgi:hypothetical protein